MCVNVTAVILPPPNEGRHFPGAMRRELSSVRIKHKENGQESVVMKRILLAECITPL